MVWEGNRVLMCVIQSVWGRGVLISASAEASGDA